MLVQNFYFILTYFFLIPAVIAQIFKTAAGLAILIELRNKEVKVETFLCFFLIN